MNMLERMNSRNHIAISSVLTAVFIIIIATISIIYCEEIPSPTEVENSPTEVGFIARNELGPTTVPYDPYFSDRNPTDACTIDQTIVVSNSSVRLKAFTGARMCSFDLTSEMHCGLSIFIQHSGLKSAYSYFYINVLGNETQTCAGQYLLLSKDSIPCMTIIKGKHFRISFQYTEIIFEIRAEDGDMVECFGGPSDSIAVCNLDPFKNQLGHKIEHISHQSLSWVSFNVTRYLFNCTCRLSSLPGLCVLDYSEWHHSCNNEMGTATTRKDWIRYYPDVKGISFADTGLCNITARAFHGLYSLLYLVLHHNNIRTLPVGLFRDVSLLEVLDFSFNNISYLASAIFDSLHVLRYLDLSYNTVFMPQTSLLEIFIVEEQMQGYLLHLGHNGFVLPEEVFKSVTNIQGIIDLSDNKLLTFPKEAFASLETIQGTLNLSQNDFKTLPDGMFSSLKEVWHHYEERAVIDLSHNDLMTLPNGIFTALWLVDGGTIDLMYNNLTALPDEMFASLMAIKDGYLGFSHNHISSLPIGAFTSLMVVNEGTIDLSHNDLARLPLGVFSALQKMILGTFNFSNNDLAGLPRDAFSSLHILDGTIDLTKNSEQITLSDGIFSSLEEMRTTFNLSHYKLSTLPLGIFTSLQMFKGIIDFSHNELSSLPDGMFISLSKIDGTLNLRLNNLSTIPDEMFSSLVEIRGVVDISRNNLTILPDGIFSALKNIIHGTIDLSYNNLVMIPPEAFNVLKNLYGKLDLSHNGLNTLPYNMLTSLRTIHGRFDLSHNNLTLLAGTIFASLEEIHGALVLSHNSLVSLPHGMLSSLKQINGSLDLSYNAMIRLSYELFASVQILHITLDLRYNNHTLEGGTASGIFTSLEDVWGPVFTYSEETSSLNGDMKSLRVLIGDFNLSSRSDLTTLPDGIFVSLEEIIGTVNLSHNDIVDLPNGIFKTLWNIDGNLDMSFNELIALPDGIFDLLYVVRGTLDISFNKMTTLPENLFPMLKSILGTLDLCFNKLVELPGRIFTALRQIGNMLDLNYDKSNDLQKRTSFTSHHIGGTLNLSHNELNSWHSETFNSLESIYGTLDMSRNYLSLLTDGLCTSLKTMDGTLTVSNNKLVTLSDELFSTIEELKGTIDLRYNSLTKISGVMIALLNQFPVKFNFSGNDVETYTHARYVENINLGALDLSYNNLTTLPQGIFTHSLEMKDAVVRLSHNRLTALPDGIFTSVKLSNSTIDLHNNSLRKLPSTAFRFLQADFGNIYLQENELTELPNAMFTSIGLTFLYLDIRYNRLELLPDNIFTTSVSLSGALKFGENDLTKLPAGIFGSLKIFLGMIDFSHNNLTDLPKGIFDSITFMVYSIIYFGHNMLVRVPILFPNLNLNFLEENRETMSLFKDIPIPDSIFTNSKIGLAIRLRNNKLTELHEDTFIFIINLSVLYLDHNDLIALPERIFNTTHSLLLLDLSYNKLKTLADGIFRFLGKLEILDLDNNEFVNLPGTIFESLYDLTTINLSGNRLVINSIWFKSLSKLETLNMSRNAIEQFPPDLFHLNVNLKSLTLSENSLQTVPSNAFVSLSQLLILNLGKNALTSLPLMTTMVKLQMLVLSDNNLTNLTPETLNGLNKLRSVYLSGNLIFELQSHVFFNLHFLKFLNLSENRIQKIGYDTFGNNVEAVDLRHNDMYRVTHDSFESLNRSTTVVLVDTYSTCCFIDHAQCVSRESQPSYLTCKRMLPYYFVRIPMWLTGLFAFFCNGAALIIRSRKKDANKVQSLFIVNLSVSDLFMGISMLILVVSDVYYKEFFPAYAQIWTKGFACKIAGFLSILSSEGSIFFITLISIDRFLAIKFPFGSHYRFTTKTARMSISIAWSIAALIGAIAILLAGEKSSIFNISEVCIGVPIIRPKETSLKEYSVRINETFYETRRRKIATTETFFGGIRSEEWQGYEEMIQTLLPSLNKSTKGGTPANALVDTINDIKIISANVRRTYQNVSYFRAVITGNTHSPIFAIFIFVALNLLCFIVVTTCYVEIFRTVSNSSRKVESTQTRKTEVRMARKMFAIIFTDFCCWVPLCIACILAQCEVIVISPEMYAWVVGFILPINSTINPIVYVIQEAISDYYKNNK